MPSLDVSLVTHAPDLPQVRQLLASLVESRGDLALHLFVEDNGADASAVDEMEQAIRSARTGKPAPRL